eukprot:46653-Pleurochrysis_carterae.AAC.2
MRTKTHLKRRLELFPSSSLPRSLLRARIPPPPGYRTVRCTPVLANRKHDVISAIEPYPKDSSDDRFHPKNQLLGPSQNGTRSRSPNRTTFVKTRSELSNTLAGHAPLRIAR